MAYGDDGGVGKDDGVNRKRGECNWKDETLAALTRTMALVDTKEWQAHTMNEVRNASAHRSALTASNKGTIASVRRSLADASVLNILSTSEDISSSVPSRDSLALHIGGEKLSKLVYSMTRGWTGNVFFLCWIIGCVSVILSYTEHATEAMSWSSLSLLPMSTLT